METSLDQTPFVRTERLRIVPLTPRLLTELRGGATAFERATDVRWRGEAFDGGEFADVVASIGKNVADDVDSWRWKTLWLLILDVADGDGATVSTVVGSFDFKSPPDERGSVEIGYGLGPEFEGNGYMTETVRKMTKIAFSGLEIAPNRRVRATEIVAEVAVGNEKSRRVLERCGFQPTNEERSFWSKRR